MEIANGNEDENGMTEVDSLTLLQQKLDEFAVMMYSYVGILQRDAVPIQREGEVGDGSGGKNIEEDVKAKDLVKRREELQRQAVEFAGNIGKWL